MQPFSKNVPEIKKNHSPNKMICILTSEISRDKRSGTRRESQKVTARSKTCNGWVSRGKKG